MSCRISEEQLWSWIDRDAPELQEHLAACPECRARAAALRESVSVVAGRSTAASPALPEKIGSYAVKRLLGEGGQGLVFEAEQQTPRRRVALKVLKTGRLLDQHGVKLFQREIETLARLTHPAIAAIYEAGQTEEGRYFYTMELVSGVPLSTHVRVKQLPLAQRLELFRAVCEAVDYAHRQGVVHRDLKPSNIIIDREGGPKILDFGLARITDADVTVTATPSAIGNIMGTLPYMSPEQARGEGRGIDERADVYALGVILYELLTDQLPYEVSSGMLPEAVRIICEQPPKRPSTINRTLRGDPETIVLKALEKEVSRRYQSVRDLEEDVRRYLSNEPILARPPSRLYVLRKKLSKHRLWVGLAAAAVALGLIGLWAGSWWKDRLLEQQRDRELAEARHKLLLIQDDLERGHVDRAQGESQPIYSEYPQLLEACLVRAQAFFGSQEPRARLSASRMLESELERDPRRWPCAALLAEISRETGDLSRAAELEARVERDASDTADAWYLRSFATLDKVKALQCVEQAVKHEPSHVFAWERLTCLCLILERPDRALDGAERLMHLGVSADRWALIKAQILAKQRRYDEAIGQYNALISADREVPAACRGRAHIYRRLGRYEQAVDDYTKALEERLAARQSAEWFYYQRATPLWILGRTEEAEKDYRRFRELYRAPSYGDARLYLILRDSGRHAEAEEVLSRALRDLAADAWLAKIFECLNGDRTPETLIEDARGQKDPEHLCEAYYYAGEAYRLSGDLGKAWECFETCVRTGIEWDLDAGFEPMNEYELAQWRLNTLPAQTRPASRPGGG